MSKLNAAAKAKIDNDLSDLDLDTEIADAVGEAAPENADDFAEPDTAPAPKPRKASPAKKAAPANAKSSLKTTRIILEDNDDIPPTGLYVGVNGKGYLIRTGIEVDVPNSVLEVLKHATKTAPIIDPDSRRVVGWRNRQRFPYAVVSAT